jgi:diketogulonate reductase-like aldo/keto reductase
VTDLAQKHSATPAQMVLAWHLGNGNIVIPKTTHPERMRENLAAAGMSISSDELDAFTALDSDARIGSDPFTAAFSQM